MNLSNLRLTVLPIPKLAKQSTIEWVRARNRLEKTMNISDTFTQRHDELYSACKSADLTYAEFFREHFEFVCLKKDIPHFPTTQFARASYRPTKTQVGEYLQSATSIYKRIK